MNYITQTRTIVTTDNEYSIQAINALIETIEDIQNDNLYTTDGDELRLVALNSRTTETLAIVERQIDNRPVDLQAIEEVLFATLGQYCMGVTPNKVSDGNKYLYLIVPDDTTPEDTDDTTPEDTTPDYMVCTDCLMAIANDDYTGLDYHYTEKQAKKREKRIRQGIADLSQHGHIVTTDYTEEFSHSECACCDETLAGTRHGVNVIKVSVPCS